MPNEDFDTQPTLLTVVEIVKAIADRLTAIESTLSTMLGQIEAIQGRIEAMRGQIEAMQGQIEAMRDQFTTEIASLRKEMNDGFRMVNHKIEILNENTLEVRANQRDLFQRVTDLESKAG